MSRTLADLTPGTLVYIDETISGTTNHEPYIYLGIDDYGKARVLRKYCNASKRMHSSNVASYSGCEADVYLEDETTGFLSRFDSAILNALEYTTIGYTDYNSNGQGTIQLVTITRRCFLLSYTEFGWSATSAGSEGKSFLSALKAFYGMSTDNTARIPRKSDETAVNAWVRSGSSATQFRLVYTSGTANSNNATNSNYWLRPALSFAPATIVSDEGAESIFLLPDGRVTTWNIEATMSLGVTDEQPKQCKLVVPTETFQTVNLWVCNNYGDDSPTWVSCSNGGVATFGTSKTADNWELGVKIEALSNVPGRKIGEPAMIVKY